VVTFVRYSPQELTESLQDLPAHEDTVFSYYWIVRETVPTTAFVEPDVPVTVTV
jgi:hypothetical protein